MPAAVDIKMLGDTELIRALSGLENAVQKKIVRKALRQEGKFALKEIKQRIRAIRVTGRHTGPLERFTRLRAIKRSRSRIGVRILTPTRAELGIGPKQYYWPIGVELGTSKSAPQSYMRSVINSNQSTRFARIGRYIGEGIAVWARTRRTGSRRAA